MKQYLVNTEHWNILTLFTHANAHCYFELYNYGEFWTYS